MQIICTTTTAAAQVLMILLTAKLWPRYDYELRPVISPLPPITFILHLPLIDPLIEQIEGLPETLIVT